MKNKAHNGRKAIAALDRAAYFAQPGATPAGWRGGPRLVQANQRREANRRACRRPVAED